MISTPLVMQPQGATTPRTPALPTELVTHTWWTRFERWLLMGGYASMYVHTVVRWARTQLPEGIALVDVDAHIQEARAQLDQRADLLPQTKRRYTTQLAQLQEFSLFQRGKGLDRPDPWALPPRLAELPEWLCTPLSRYVRLRRRHWPVDQVQRQTRNVVGPLCTILSFFLSQYHWKDWSELSLRWVDAYIEAGLQRGLSTSTLNGALFPLQMFCRFLCDEGYPVPLTLTRFKTLNLPHRLPRPLTDEQVRRLEQTIQSAINVAANTDGQPQAVMDLAWFYLLWHCGLRLSEAQRLAVNDLDLEGRKLLVRHSKERKDRVVYLSDATVAALRQHLSTRPDPHATQVFTYQQRAITTRTLERRLARYGQAVQVKVTPHRLRHTFASQMLSAGMPIASLQHYLGHEDLDTTLVYAEVSDPLVQQDYYRGIIVVDPASVSLVPLTWTSVQRVELERLMAELKVTEQGSKQQQEILERIQQLLAQLR